MGNIRLSHSAINTYRECPRMYKLKYVDKYRETTTGSALTFGSAIGDTFQMIILDRKENLTEEEKQIKGLSPYDFFDSEFSTTEINGETIDLPNSPRSHYFKGDWDESILQQEDWDMIDSYRSENGFLDVHTWNTLYSERINGTATEAEISFLNLHFWLSLRRKGHLMIKEFLDKIYPKIKKVYEIEGKIKIENGDGDSIIGYLDLLADYEYEGEVKKMIIDFKTSSQKYNQKKLDDSQQLTLYNYDREVGDVGYIVAIKKVKTPKIGKRKGETHTEIQELMGRIEENTQEKIVAEIDGILCDIKNEVYPQKKSNKDCLRIFGKRCAYYDLCFNNDDSKLFKKEKV